MGTGSSCQELESCNVCKVSMVPEPGRTAPKPPLQKPPQLQQQNLPQSQNLQMPAQQERQQQGVPDLKADPPVMPYYNQRAAAEAASGSDAVPADLQVLQQPQATSSSSKRNDAAEEIVDVGKIASISVAEPISPGLEGAKAVPAEYNPMRNEPQSNLTEPEEEPHVRLARENFKSLAAAIVVFLCFVILITVLLILRSAFTPPDCEETRIIAGVERPIYDQDELRSCDPCGEGTNILPLFGEWEKTWPKVLRIILYLVGLLWTFLGIGIVCDQFMGAIEEITSAERVVWIEVQKGSKQKFHVKVWNGTVANLTLMALGSSAPEILLSIIENVGAGFYAGSLGPSTIVGSAAFNLLIITAVCISAIPAPDVRKIEGTDVYMVTASLSLFAYFWLLVILQWITPDKVDLEEAIVTFLFFPFLIIIAFTADRGWLGDIFRPQGGHANAKVLSMQRSEAELARLEETFGKELPRSALLMMSHAGDENKTKSRAQYRKGLMNNLTSGKKVDKNKGSMETVIGFEKPEHAVLECAGKLRLKLLASRAPGAVVQLRYYTKEGSAKAGIRFGEVDNTIRFTANQTERYIDIPIIDNDTWEPDEYFVVNLCELQVLSTASSSTGEPRIGIGVTKVTVINDDMPGTLDFDFSEVFAKEGTTATVGVNRTHGTCGDITCKYSTKDESATKGIDYQATEGTLRFKNGEKHKTIQVSVLPHATQRFTDDRFKIELKDASPGVLFNAETDGGEESAICDVVISATAKSNGMKGRSCINQHKLRNSLKEWKNQFQAVWYCNASASEQAEAGVKDWILHCMCLFWKFVFSAVPPPSMFGGWPCFVGALGMIGVVTALVGDMASLLGCSIGLGDDITAITLVALGTSLPDTFASKSAAEEDDTADNSVGNVTGSNSVNVFLGLGLPWTMAACVWKVRGPTEEWKNTRCRGCGAKKTYADYTEYPNGGFIMPAASLGFSVAVFSVCALICIFVLFVRRKVYGGELGGPKPAQTRDSIILTMLWLVYIGASIVQSTSSSS